MRIVSLLPSATEMICALGLTDRLVGVTHECDFPPAVVRLPKVTNSLISTDAPSAEIDRMVRDQLRTDRALYTLDLPELERLRPDLIITQALCGVCAVAEAEVEAAACELPGNPRVLNLEPRTLSEVLAAIGDVAAAAEVDAVRAARVIDALEARVAAVNERTAELDQHPRAALLEWLDPPFSCGHWSPELVRLAGAQEGLGREGEPSRTLGWDEVIAWQPEVVFVACCGRSVDRTLQDMARLPAATAWDELPAARSGRVYVTDGSQYFSRPGPRLVDSLEILAHALHPQAHPLPAGLPAALQVPDPGAIERTSSVSAR